MEDAPGGPGGDIWGEEEDYEALFRAEPDETEGNEDDGDGEAEDPETDDDAGDQQPQEEDLPPALLKRLEALQAEREEALINAIENGDTNNRVYKGLQKVIARKDREIDETSHALKDAIGKIQEFEGLLSGLSEGVNWLSDTTLRALPEDDRKEAYGNLQERRLKVLQQELERQQKAAPQQQQPPQEPPAESGDEDFQKLVAERSQAFVEGRRKAAERAGVSPDDADLDYGETGEGLVERLEKFEASLLKLLERGTEAKLDKVRPKTQITPTRSSGGGNTPGLTGGDSLLERGARSRIDMMRKAGSGR